MPRAGAGRAADNASHSHARSSPPSGPQPEPAARFSADFRGFLFQTDAIWLMPRPRQEAAMKGDERVIQLLNEALKNELTAVNQYWLHYRLLDNWGIARLAEFERHESIDEMKHADRLAERILFLGGLPNFQMLGRLRIGETVEEILRADLEVEIEAVAQLKGAIALCEEVRDYVSRDLFAEILGNEEEHIDTIETQFEMIERMGLENYIQLQSKPAEG
jgi:bacterioferritin